MFKCTSGFHFFTDRMFCFSAVCKSKFHSVWTWFQSGIYFFTSPFQASFFADLKIDDVRKHIRRFRLAIKVCDDFVPCVSFLSHNVSLLEKIWRQTVMICRLSIDTV